jgi:hypothetical protein
VLVATTGMRRSELLGVRRPGLDLDAGTLHIDETLISVAGRAEESDGKTAAGVRCGRRPHPDSVTDRFNRLVDLAGVRRIRCTTSGTPTRRWR